MRVPEGYMRKYNDSHRIEQFDDSGHLVRVSIPNRRLSLYSYANRVYGKTL